MRFSHTRRSGCKIRRTALCLALLSASACGAKATSPEAPADAGWLDQGLDGGTQANDASAGGETEGGARDAGMAAACSTADAPFASPVLGLSQRAYINTIALLFGERVHLDEIRVPHDYPRSEVYPASPSDLVRYQELATEIAQTITDDPAAVSAFTGCDSVRASQADCRHTFLETFLLRAFRRPATPDEVSYFENVLASGAARGAQGFASGVRAVIEEVLQSPKFLYRIEVGEPSAERPGWAHLTPYELASRLSFFLWLSSPDDALLEAARQGKIVTNADVAIQARRLLSDDRSHRMVQDFYFQLLNLRPTYVTPDRVFFPTAPSDLGDLWDHETRAFIDDVTWEGPGDFATVFTSPTSFMNDRLAAFYGVGGVTGSAFQRVALDPNRRGGILTQGSFLGSSHRSSAVLRGMTVAANLLCITIPEEPPGIPADIGMPPPPNATQRQRYEQHESNPACRDCHRLMDPLGFAFEHYNSVGTWQDTDNGQLVDATGEITTTDAAGKFDGAIEMMKRVVQSQAAKDCFVDKWIQFAYQPGPNAQLGCARQKLRETFAQSKFNVPELLVSLTQTDAFLYRPSGPAAP